MIRAGLHDVACELHYSTQFSVIFALALPVVLRFRRQYPLFALNTAVALCGMLLVLLYEPAFPQPMLIDLWRGFSTEGVLWIVATAVTLSTIAAWSRSEQLAWKMRRMSLGPTLVVVLTLAVNTRLLCLIIRPTPSDGMAAMPAAIGLMGAVFALLAPRGWKLYFLAAPRYLVDHMLDAAVFDGLWSSTREYWNPAARRSWQPGNLPGCGNVFGLHFGTVRPLTIVYLADVRIQDPPNSSVWTAT
jgi:hypothetical protein